MRSDAEYLVYHKLQSELCLGSDEKVQRSNVTTTPRGAVLFYLFGILAISVDAKLLHSSRYPSDLTPYPRLFLTGRPEEREQRVKRDSGVLLLENRLNRGHLCMKDNRAPTYISIHVYRDRATV